MTSVTASLSPTPFSAVPPSPKSRNDGARKSRRACVECNRKKTKCNMTLPSCALCSKGNITCTYPTSRRKRTLPTKKIPCQNSMQQDVRHSFDSLLLQLIPSTVQVDTSEDRGHDFPHGESRSAQNSASVASMDVGDQLDLAHSAAQSNASQSLIPNRSSLPMASAHPDTAFDDHFQSNHSPISVVDQIPDLLLESRYSAFQYDDANDPLSTNYDFFSFINGPLHPNPPSPLEKTWLSASTSLQKPESRDALFELDIPQSLIEELVTIYFAKVHCFIPILHRPQFMAKYFSGDHLVSHDHDQPNLEKLFLFHNMLALAARFSTSTYFEDVPLLERGTKFAEKAKLLYRESLHMIENPTLEYLQGCTLLAWYLYLSGPDSQGWLMIGTCSRLAYDLGIEKVDLRDCKSTTTPTSLDWRRREELRRVWWSIWELDTFASAISCRSHTMDRTKAAVMLPVSDENWFADIPVESVIIDPDPLHAWYSLRDCPNQDERAWFLLINYLLLIAHDLSQQRKPIPEDIENIEKAVACYVLLLPPQFHLDSDLNLISFNAENYAKCNWIICTNIMLQGCRTFIKFSTEKASAFANMEYPNRLIGPLAAESSWKVRTVNYHAYAEQVFCAIQKWPPTYMPYSSPIIGGLVLGPAAIHLRVAIDRGKIDESGKSPLGVEGEMLKLCLTQIARFWKIGLIFLEIAKSISA